MSNICDGSVATEDSRVVGRNWRRGASCSKVAAGTADNAGHLYSSICMSCIMRFRCLIRSVGQSGRYLALYSRYITHTLTAS